MTGWLDRFGSGERRNDRAPFNASLTRRWELSHSHEPRGWEESCSSGAVHLSSRYRAIRISHPHIHVNDRTRAGRKPSFDPRVIDAGSERHCHVNENEFCTELVRRHSLKFRATPWMTENQQTSRLAETHVRLSLESAQTRARPNPPGLAGPISASLSFPQMPFFGSALPRYFVWYGTISCR